MSGGLVKSNTGALALKGELADLLGDQLGFASDLSEGVSIGYPVLSIKGKTFHVNEGGESELLMSPHDANAPATTIELVMIKANRDISKVWYETGYVEGSTEAPDCYSNDGTVPAADSANRQSPTCASCRWNQWGSKITEQGSKAKACADSRRTAVAAADDIDRAMLLRVPAASLKPLQQFGQILAKRGVPYNAVVMKLTFDFSVSHPLLKFGVARAVSVEEARKIAEMIKSDTVEAILHGNASSIAQEQAEGGAVSEEEDAALDQAAANAAAAGLKADGGATTPAPKPTQPSVSAETVAAAVGAEPPKRTRKPKAAPAAAEPAKATPPAEPVAAKVVADSGLDAAIGDLLADFE
jgi:hypothetical protein